MAVPQTSDILREVIFAPLEHGGRAQVIFDRLRNAVALDVFKDGEQLPPETDLAAQMGISPVTLRDAIRLMREAGLLETRRGRTGGSFVRRNGYDSVAHGYSQLGGFSLVDLRDLSDWRISVVEAASWLAAERASDDEVAAMAQLVQGFTEAEDSPTARRAEGRFYIAVAAASQSVRLTRATVACAIDYGPMLSVAYQDAALRGKASGHHHALLRAIADGRSADAAQAVRDAGSDAATALAGRKIDLSVGSRG
ncbi:FadR/GntR family transcriptional regulator [Mycolicibacterium sp. A43C]